MVIPPHKNGFIWYEGAFVKRNTKSIPGRNYSQCVEVGIHKIYFENGRLRGVVDYDNRTIKEYDNERILKCNTTFENHDLHGQKIALH